MEVGCIAGQNDALPGGYAPLIAVELIAEADVENAGHDRVDPGRRVLCGISFTPEGTLTLIT